MHLLICPDLQDTSFKKDNTMKQILQRWAIRGSLIAALSFACLAPILTAPVSAAPSGDGFRISYGGRSGGYMAYGRGRYGYGPGYGYGHGYPGYRSNRLPYYGSGPYGYGGRGNVGWNQGYRSYSPYGAYNSNYYNPYSTWTYNPYGMGIQQSFGY
jgi:hypothetical protein